MHYSLRLNHFFLAALICLGKVVFATPVPAGARESLEREVAIYTTQDRVSLKSAILESIAQAQKSILIFAFTLSDPAIIEALTRKAEAGLEVTVVIDKNHIEDIKDYGKRDTGILSLTRLADRVIGKKNNGMEVIIRDGEGHVHHKLLIIDKKEIWAGSANFVASSYSSQENMMFRFVSPELAQFLYQEADMFRGKGIRGHKKPLSIQLVDQQLSFCLLPHSYGDWYQTEEEINYNSKALLIAKMREAKSSLKIAMNVLTSNDLTEEIIAAHKRGVNVEVVVADMIGNVAKLCNARIPVTLYTASLMHNKLMCIDDTILINGSANWSQGAFVQNDENFIIIEGMTSKQKEQFAHYWSYLKDVPQVVTVEFFKKTICQLKEELQEKYQALRDRVHRLETARSRRI